MDRQPLVSINIPCYRQLDHARRALSTALAQSFEDFEVTVLDDGASDEYREMAESFGDARVRYQPNATRLGAMRNMFAAIRAGRGKYTLAFHEDDLLGTHYLEAAVELLEAEPRRGFVACELREFYTEPSAAELSQRWDGQRYDEISTAADYLRAIFRGVEPMFGSIVYRRTALDGVEPQHEMFATLVDRPFLLSILRTWSAAIIRAPLVWYRHHGEGDVRHGAMSTDHILRLVETYRSTLPQDWTTEDQELFYAYSSSWLFELYQLTPLRDRPPFRQFLLDAWKRGLYKATLRGRFGLWHLRKHLLAPRRGAS